MFEVMQRLVLGNHAALFYRNRKEQFDAMMPYIHIGLARKERCFYVVGDNSVRMVLEAMEASGIDVARHTDSGALTVTTVQEAFLKDGVFDPERMIADLAQEVERSVALGYSGFRGTGEMLWTLSLPGAAQQLQRYEAELDRRLPAKFLALCQYNERCFGPDLTSDVLRTHSKVIARGRIIENFYHTPQPDQAQKNVTPALERLLTVG